MRKAFKGTHPAKRKSDDRKLNPATILSVMWDVAGCFYDNYRSATLDLKDKRRKEKHNRPDLTENQLRNIFEDKSHIKYWHLELFSEKLSIPSGLFLLFSRMRSNSEKARFEDNEKILSLMRHIAATTSPSDSFSVGTLLRWSDVLNQRTGREKLEMCVHKYGEVGRPLSEKKKNLLRAHLNVPIDERLSDRGIARELGISPQTVGNWRRRLSRKPSPGE